MPARTAKLAGHRDPDHPVIARPLAELTGEEPSLVFVHPHHRAIRPALGEEPALGGEISAHAAVPVEMVGTEIGEDRDIRCQRPGELGLVARQFQHHHAAIPGRIDIEHATTDIAGQLRGAARGLENVVDQRRGGGFAVRAGHRHHPRQGVMRLPAGMGQRAKEQPDVIVDRHPRRLRRRHHRVGRRVEMRDARRNDQPCDVVEGAPFPQVDDLEALVRGPVAGLRVVIPADRDRAALAQGAGGGEAGAAEAENCDAGVFETGYWDHCGGSFDMGRTGGQPPDPRGICSKRKGRDAPRGAVSAP